MSKNGAGAGCLAVIAAVLIIPCMLDGVVKRRYSNLSEQVQKKIAGNDNTRSRAEEQEFLRQMDRTYILKRGEKLDFDHYINGIKIYKINETANKRMQLFNMNLREIKNYID